MIAFFTVIFLAVQFDGTGLFPLFMFAIPVLVLVCIFDGFNLRRRINAGEILTDNIDDIADFVRRNRTMIIGFLLLLAVISVIGTILPWLIRIVPIVIAIWAISVLFRKKP